MLAVDRTFVLIWRWVVAESLDNQSPRAAESGGAGVAPISPPTPTRKARAPRARRTGLAGSDGPEPVLHLDLTAVAGAAGLGHEVSLLRAAIRRLADEEDASPHVKTLAELRHQVEALCTALKTQHALDGRGNDLSADLARALEELGDELGVPR